MNNVEARWGSERGYHLFKTSEVAVNMITERINLENLGLTLKVLPLCTEEESVYIEELIPRAKEGFALIFNSHKSTKEQDRDLLFFTSPQSTEGIWPQVRLTDEQNTLPEYWHVLATLKALSDYGRVSFYRFPDPPTNMDYRTGMAETYWTNSADTFEKVWVAMEELENLVRSALYSTDPMRNEDMLKVGHFFMTGKSISNVFDNL